MFNIIAISRNYFDSFCGANNFHDENVPQNGFFICIHNTSGDENVTPHFKKNHQNVLNLWFDDCSEDKKNEKAFTEEQAQKIIDFLDKQKDLGGENGVIHCHAGISRSGAVATFAMQYLGMSADLFKRINPKINPNPHVLATLNSVLWKNHFNIIYCGTN